MTRRNLILDAVDDAVEYLLEDGRTEDKDLPPGAIADALAEDEIDPDDMVRRFRMRLYEALGIKR